MFAQFLVIVLLGSTLVSASPIDNEIYERGEFTDKLTKWWGTVINSFESFFQKKKQSFEELVAELKEESQQIVNIGKEELVKLKQKYNDAVEKVAAKIEHQKILWENRLKEALKHGKEQFERTKQESKQALANLYQKWQTSYFQVKEEVKSAFKIEESAKQENIEKEVEKLEEINEIPEIKEEVKPVEEVKEEPKINVVPEVVEEVKPVEEVKEEPKINVVPEIQKEVNQVQEV